MKVYDAGSIRNVAIVGHGGCGKTQLVSTLLFAAGAVNRIGRVDEGTTVTDFDEEEIARKHTLSSSLAYAEWQKTKINFIDTPGFANFLTDARSALRVAEAAVLVVDAVAGVEVQTEKLWAEAASLGLPRIVVLNRLDRERASLDRALESLRRDCAREIIPVQLPLGEEKAFIGVVDLVKMKAQTFAADGKMTETDIPAALTDTAQHAREQLIEMVAEADEQLMETFFAEGTLTQEQLVGGLRSATMAGKLFPLLCTSATHATGMQPLLDAIVNYAPSPAERDFRTLGKDGAETTTKASDTAPYAAFVWKTIADPFAGRITMLRIVSGTVKSDTTVNNATREAPERLGHLLALQGKTQTHVPELKAGDLGAVAKLKDTHTNDVLADKATADPRRADHLPRAGPLVRDRAEEPRRRRQDQHRDAPPRRRGSEHQVRARSADPRAAARRPGSAAHRGHRREAEAAIRRRGEPEAAADSVSGDDHRVHRGARPPQEADRRPRTVRRLQDSGSSRCRAAATSSSRTTSSAAPSRASTCPPSRRASRSPGCAAISPAIPMVDFKATVFDGSYHAVDSNELSFKMAGSLAFKDAMTRARPTILEPVMKVEVYTPSDFAGDLMGDLNGRRGRIAGMDTRGTMTVIRAQVPMSEMLTYEQHLTSATGGRGSYHMEYSHYEEVPHVQQAKIIAAYKAERGQVVAEEV